MPRAPGGGDVRHLEERRRVGLGVGRRQEFDRARELHDQHAAVGQELDAVGRLKPVARTSFWNELELVTLTGTGAETVELPAASRARAVSVCAPFATARVSQASP